MMRPNIYTTLLLSLFLSATAAAARVQAAEAEDEFRLNVYGMYCNQCAYGLEQSLQHTDGVIDAIVDLQNNSAVVKVAPFATPRAETLAQKTLNQGISVKQIEATLTGQVQRTADGWELLCGSERFSLTSSTDGGPNLDLLANRTVTLEGIFAGIEGVDGAAGESRFIAHSSKE